MRVYLIETVREEFTPDTVYWAFDWDDNILTMPTQIVLLDDKGEDVLMSTEDFAEHRHQIGVEPFKYKGKNVVSYANDPYRFFSTKGDKRFLIDVMFAKEGPEWNKFAETINNGSIFAIVTARGHSPLVIRKAIENMIESNYKGINKKELVKNLRKYRHFAEEDDMSDNELIEAYMDMNKYYPVTYGQGSAAQPEKLKVEALKEFHNYVNYISGILHKPAYLKNLISNRFVPKVVFSDDDRRNIEYAHKNLSKDPESKFEFILTQGGKRQKYEPEN
jgi:hypothetical protein